MADHVTANPGSGGATFATDEIGGVHHPLTKVEWGPPDAAVPVEDAAGKRLPVKVGDPLPAGTNLLGLVALSGELPSGTNLLGRVAAAPSTDALMAGATALTPRFAAVSAAASGENTVLAAQSGKRLRVLAYTLVAEGPVAAQWRSGSGAALSGAMALCTNGSLSPAFCPAGLLETGVGEALLLHLSAASGVRGHVTYVEV